LSITASQVTITAQDKVQLNASPVNIDC
jgi:hypothetical protein